MFTISLIIITLGIVLLYIDSVIAVKIPFKQKLKLPTFWGYILLFLGFFGLIHSGLTVTFAEPLNIQVNSNTAPIIEATSKLLWPVAAFLTIFLLRLPLRNLLLHGKWEWDANEKKLRYLGQLAYANASEIKTQITNDTANDPEFIRTFAQEIGKEMFPTIGSDPSKRESFLLTNLAKAIFREQFEKAYNKIFGTQIEALVYLRSSGKGALSIYFDEHKKRVYEAIENPNEPIFPNWIGFLLAYKFISFDDKYVEITEIGKNFLQYIEAQNYTLQRAL